MTEQTITFTCTKPETVTMKEMKLIKEAFEAFYGKENVEFEGDNVRYVSLTAQTPEGEVYRSYEISEF